MISSSIRLELVLRFFVSLSPHKFGVATTKNGMFESSRGFFVQKMHTWLFYLIDAEIIGSGRCEAVGSCRGSGMGNAPTKMADIHGSPI